MLQYSINKIFFPASLCGSDFKSDVWFLLDGSSSTTDEEFKTVMKFSSDMASQFNVSADKVQLGLSIYSYKHEILYNLTEETDLNQFQSATNSAQTTPGLYFLFSNWHAFDFL